MRLQTIAILGQTWRAEEETKGPALGRRRNWRVDVREGARQRWARKLRKPKPREDEGKA